jgi:hypothetical protein
LEFAWGVNEIKVPTPVLTKKTKIIWSCGLKVDEWELTLAKLGWYCVVCSIKVRGSWHYKDITRDSAQEKYLPGENDVGRGKDGIEREKS